MYMYMYNVPRRSVYELGILMNTLIYLALKTNNKNSNVTYINLMIVVSYEKIV